MGRQAHIYASDLSKMSLNGNMSKSQGICSDFHYTETFETSFDSMVPDFQRVGHESRGINYQGADLDLLPPDVPN